MVRDAILIRGARQLLTLRGPGGPRRGAAASELGIIPDGALLIRDGRIQEVGRSRRVENLSAARGAEEIDATGCVVMPSFVDPALSVVHARPHPRGLQAIQSLYNTPTPALFREPLEDSAESLSRLSTNSLRRRAEKIVFGMARSGLGTVQSHAGYALAESGSLKVLRVQKSLNGLSPTIASSLALYPVAGVPSSSWVRYACERLLPLVRRRCLASAVHFENDSRLCPPENAMEILAHAKSLGFRLSVGESFVSPGSPISVAINSDAATVANLRNIDDREIAALASSDAVAILRPGIALHAGMNFAEPGRALLDAGVAVALSSGYHAELSPGYSSPLTLLLACKLYGLRPEEAIVAATTNAAHAMGVAGSVGSLECGKRADCIVLEVPDYREIAYSAGHTDVGVQRLAIRPTQPRARQTPNVFRFVLPMCSRPEFDGEMPDAAGYYEAPSRGSSTTYGDLGENQTQNGKR